VVVARRDFALPIANEYTRPWEAGTDRLLNAVAARERAGGRGAVAVDFGTAISVSVVSPQGAFLGGPIACGGAALARGLRASAPRLPHAEASSRTPFVARDTVSALGTGVFWEIAGGVRALLQGILRSVDFRPRVFATGGEAETYRESIPEIDELVPNLVLEGLCFACRAREFWKGPWSDVSHP
jgi:type III pantothenate kinase